MLTLSLPRLHKGKRNGFEGCEAGDVPARDARDTAEREKDLSGKVVGQHEVMVHHREGNARSVPQTLLT